MRIEGTTLTVQHPEQAANFYRDVLQFPVHDNHDQVVVTVGASRLFLNRGAEFAGIHHLAFGISPNDFESARSWLSNRVELVTVNGSDIVAGPAEWNSRSVYFSGPEGILLEYIARQADSDIPGSRTVAPQPVSISEVGIGVPDVATAVTTHHQPS